LDFWLVYASTFQHRSHPSYRSVVFELHRPITRFGEDIMFWGCPTVRSFVRTYLLTTIGLSRERLEQFQWNVQGYSFAPNNDLIRFWRSKVKGQGYNRPSKWRRRQRRRWGVEDHLCRPPRCLVETKASCDRSITSLSRKPLLFL